MKTWLITGCSSGLGLALSKAVLEHGDQVVMTARDVDTISGLAATSTNRALALMLDVTDHEQIKDAVAAVEHRFGAVDVLVNNAGYGYRAAVEEGDEREVARLFGTHVFGATAAMKAVLPGMRARGTGIIINMSSIGARLALPGSGYYAAAKAALEALSSALGKEVAPLGVRVIAIERGRYRTDFAGRSLVGSDVRIEDYDATAGLEGRKQTEPMALRQGIPARPRSSSSSSPSQLTHPGSLSWELTHSPRTTRRQVRNVLASMPGARRRLRRTSTPSHPPMHEPGSPLGKSAVQRSQGLREGSSALTRFRRMTSAERPLGRHEGVCMLDYLTALDANARPVEVEPTWEVRSGQRDGWRNGPPTCRAAAASSEWYQLRVGTR
jgi:NAD(P)-dependent dehydrogenase (short-subunit alcohol dehydrogenase family)